MVRLNQFQHEIPSIGLKYAFFADCIENSVDKIGVIYDFDLETHLSLFEKMLFQIERNPNQCIKYILNHFQNRLVRTNDIFVLKRLSSDIQYLETNRGNLAKIQRKLLTIVKKLKKNQLKWYLDEIVEVCLDENQTPKSSRNVLEYYAILIVSEFIFSDFSKDEINEIPNIIIPNKKREYGIKKDLQGREKVGFKSQIQRINRYFRKPKLQLRYIAGLKDAQANEKSFEYHYEGMTIISSENEKLKDVVDISFYDPSISDFREKFLESKSLLVYQVLSTNSEKEGLKKFYQNIEHLLKHLSSISKSLVTVDRSEYQATNIKNNHSTSATRPKMAFFSSEIIRLSIGKYGNLNLEFGTHVLSRDVERFKKIDKIYYMVMSETDEREQILLFWRYLEGLFIHLKHPKEKALEIIKEVCRILVVNEEKRYIYQIKNGLINIVINHYPMLEATHYQFFDYSKKELKYDEFKHHKPAYEHNFISSQIKKIEDYQKNRQKNINDSYQYNRLILTESYEQRNFLTHDFEAMPLATKKLSFILPQIIRRLRLEIAETILKYDLKDVSLQNILELQSKKGVRMLFGNKE